MNDRAVSEVVGYALVFSLIVTGVTLVSVLGVGELTTQRNFEQTQNAERAFDVLSGHIADVYSQEAASRGTEISLGQAQLLVGDPVEITVTLVDSGGSNPSETFETRPLVYRGQANSDIAYEAGAVYRVSKGSQEGAVRLRDPPFMFRGSGSDELVMVSIPRLLLSNTSPESISGTTVLVRTGNSSSQVGQVWQRDTDGTYEEVRITVTSPRFEQWRTYMEDAGLTGCTTNAAANEVECTYDGSGSIERVYVVHHEIPVSLDE